MSGFDNFNTRIATLNRPYIPAPVATIETSTKEEETETKNKKSYAKTGATIAASVALAGIAIAKRGVIMRYARNLMKNSTSNMHFDGNPSGPVKVNKKTVDVEARDRDIFLNERLKDIIREKYEKITDIAIDSPQRQVERLKALVRPQDKKLQFQKEPLFTSHEAEMVTSFLDEYAFNIPLRLGKIRPEKSIEIRTLDNMIQNSRFLNDDATVYRGIITKKDGEVLEFAKNLKVGNVLEDKAFVATSRNAAETIAKYGEENCYVMRIKLPPETQGIDCRRFTMLDMDKGAHAVFILPRNSKFLINSIDDRTKIIDAQCLLQN